LTYPIDKGPTQGIRPTFIDIQDIGLGDLLSYPTIGTIGHRHPDLQSFTDLLGIHPFPISQISRPGPDLQPTQEAFRTTDILHAPGGRLQASTDLDDFGVALADVSGLQQLGSQLQLLTFDTLAFSITVLILGAIGVEIALGIIARAGRQQRQT
jgi:hypothetical protein